MLKPILWTTSFSLKLDSCLRMHLVVVVLTYIMCVNRI